MGPDPGHISARPRKTRRWKMKHEILLQMATAKNAKEMHHQLQKTASKHPYIRAIIGAYLNMSYVSSDNETVFSV